MYSIKRIIKYILGKDILPNIEVSMKNTWFGSEYGGFYVCEEYLNQDSIVLSFGVGKDITFDLDLIENFGLTVYAFDPTPETINWINRKIMNPNFKFFSYGIADYDGNAKFMPPENPDHVSHTILGNNTNEKGIVVPVKCIKTIINDLNLEAIDLLKMDIEGAEYGVIQDLKNLDIRPKQIILEFHHNFEFVELDETKNAILDLRSMGYRLYNYSKNGYEYSFVRLD